MQGWVKEKLDKIDELFPQKRLEKSKSRITSVWKGKLPDDRLPYTCMTVYLNVYNDYNGVDEKEIRLRVLLDECILHGKMNDDFIPSLFPGCKTSTIPNMFGAEEVLLGNDYSAKNIINNLEDIDRLTEPDMSTGTVANEWLCRQQYFLDQTEGRIPIHITDMQGPMDVAGVMWGYEDFFLALHSNHEYAQKLLNKITDAFIKFWKAQKDILGDTFLGTHLFGFSWVPENNGATVSADSMVMVSPEYFDKYYLPVFNNISKEFGGITIHSCGQFAHLMNNIQNIQNLKGLNASQMSLTDLQNAGLKKNVPLILLSEYDQIIKEAEQLKATCQPVDITVSGMCNDCSVENPKPPETWTAKDWDTFRKYEDKLLETLAL